MFAFPNQQKVWGTTMWQQFLDGQAAQTAGKIERWQLRPPLEMESNVEIVRRVVQQRQPTRTGQRIFEACRSTRRKIHFIGWRMVGGGRDGVALAGFSSFENDCPVPGEATIYVNLDLCLQVQSPGDPNPNKILNGYIILLHEMGHARQWLTFGDRFNSMAAKNEVRGQRVASAEASVRDGIMKGPGSYKSKRTLIEQAVLKRVGHADFYGKQFPNDLELLNWLHHEGPICDDWKIARRPAYTAISNVW